MKARLERCWTMDGYDLTVWKDEGHGNYSVPKLANIQWQTFTRDEGVPRGEYEWNIRRHDLMTLFESLREEMIRLGLIPRPLVEDEVKQLREQLKDTQETRDRLISILGRMGAAAFNASVKEIYYDPSIKMDPRP